MKEEEPGLSNREQQAIDVIGRELDREFGTPADVRCNPADPPPVDPPGRPGPWLNVALAGGAATLMAAVLVVAVTFLDRAVDSRIAVTKPRMSQELAASSGPVREERAGLPPERMNTWRVNRPGSPRPGTMSTATTSYPTGPAALTDVPPPKDPAVSGTADRRGFGSAPVTSGPRMEGAVAPPLVHDAKSSRADHPSARTSARAVTSSTDVSPLREQRSVQAP